jgi:heme/copper-type cytochrome/quinol oxidase subunit 2
MSDTNFIILLIVIFVIICVLIAVLIYVIRKNRNQKNIN